MNLSIPYNLDFVNVVVSFLEEIGACYGADSAEKQWMRLIGEEAFSFIIVGIPDQDFSEMFQLRCSEIDEGLSLYFSNHGRPMNVREVKDFSFDDIEGTSDGLSLKLLRGICDELSFRNMGREGWELVINFKLKNYKRILSENGETKDDTKPVISYDFIVRQTEKDDIPGIINLVYNTYRYSYAKSFAYSKELFSEAIDSGKVYSIVVASEGKIIGHQAIIFESPQLGEIGMAMVDPLYRKSRAFLLLKRRTLDDIKQIFPGIIIYIKAVTSHKSSQAFMTGFTICMLELSIYNHASFVGMNTKFNPRESLVYAFGSFSEISEQPPIYVPFEHQGIISSIFEGSGFPMIVEKNSGKISDRKSDFEIKTDEENQNSRLIFSSLGSDFGDMLRKHTRSLQQDGIITIFVAVPTHENQPEGMDKILFNNGYFFSGIKPNAKGNWDLIYTNLLHQKFNFDDIQLFSPRAVELCNYVKTLYCQIP